MHRPDPLLDREPTESKGYSDPFRFPGFDDIDEPDKHLPDFVECRRRRGAPAAPEPASVPETDEAAAARLARWAEITRAETAAHGGLMPLVEDVPPPAGGWTQIPLKEPMGPPAPPAAKAANSPDAAEAELTGVIADCRMLMREVAMASARLTCGPDERLRFINSACRAAHAAAAAGKMVAKLRAASAGAMEENRQRIIVERVERGPAAVSGGAG